MRKAVIYSAIVLAAIVATVLRLNAIDTGARSWVPVVLLTEDAPAASPVRAAYDTMLEEAGIPHRWSSAHDFALEASPNAAIVVLPDRLNRHVSAAVVPALDAFVRAGGTLVVVHDAGTADEAGRFLPASVLSGLTGIDLTTLGAGDRPTHGDRLRFASRAAAAAWNIPAGKLDASLRLSSYQYGALNYSVFGTRSTDPSMTVAARAESDGAPLITERTLGRGTVAYVGLPLGDLRAHSDSFPMIAMLRTLLLDSGRIPHLVAAPGGVGTMILDLHIDSQAEYHGIDHLRAANLLRADVPMEFDVTAGPDRDRAGDKLGFDACGPRGSRYLAILAKYGTIGSHGGWAHNEFARGVEDGSLGENGVRALVARNNACLASQLHRPITSFAAPDGAHPQPVMTRVIESLGMHSYYYTGDTGAGATRAFYDGSQVSATTWAFGVMPNGSNGSIAEMANAGVSPSAVGAWLDDTAAYAARESAVTMIYSHGYDLMRKGYDTAFGTFLDHVERDIRAGTLRLSTMPDVAAFMSRLVTTQFDVKESAGGLDVTLANPAGLRNIAFALPGDRSSGALPGGVKFVSQRGGYRTFAVEGDPREVRLHFSNAAKN